MYSNINFISQTRRSMNSKFYVLLLLTLLVGCNEKVAENLKYLKQEPPSNVPEVFAPNFISKETESEFGSIFNEEATEFFYGIDINGKEEIRHSKLVGNNWSEPETILSHELYGYNDPFLSPDESKLFFISRRALDGLGELKDYDIWYVERLGNEWSDPINAGLNINSDKNEYYMSFTNDGIMFFSSNKRDANFDIYSSKFVDGKFEKPIPLGNSINTPAYEADVFVDPEETYIIFCGIRSEGLGRGDLYISFKDPNGTWSKSINMGNKINTASHELCPYVSKDGKYLFYTSKQDIYWVSAGIINEIKNGAVNTM